MKTYLNILLFFLFTLPIVEHQGAALAQNYPIQLTTQILPPFTGYLDDYTQPGIDKLKVLIVQTDLTEPSYDIKLKIKIEGQGILIQSKPYYYAGPFNLQPGIPIQLNGLDLSALLNTNNLDFSGITKNDYEKRKILPEGFYTICITAYDYTNPIQIKVSNESCANGWMVLSEPPYLNYPSCGIKLQTSTPQQITFQWTAMNLSSPNSQFQTDYEFSLYEVRPAKQNPNNIVQTLPPIYQTVVNFTTLNYGLTEPPLIPGMEYVWRVRAMDQSGRDYFKNKGYSQVCTFTYGSIYDGVMPLTLHVQPQHSRSAKFWWDNITTYNQYKLEYRKTGNSTYTWFPVNTVNYSTAVYDLEPQTEYEARVRGMAPDGYLSDWSNTVTFTTPPPSQINCGDLPSLPPIPSAPLQVASIYMNWQVGQFEMIVTKLFNTQSLSGQYSGFGKVVLPFLGTNISVMFTNITVDETHHVVAGEVRAISDGLDKWIGNWEIRKAEENATYINGTIDSAYYQNGQVCVTTEQNSTPQCYPMPPDNQPLVIRDGEGNQITVLTDGTVIKGSYLTYSTDALDASDNVKVTFVPAVAQKFGFDEKQYPGFTEQYEVIKLKDGKSYFVPHKSIGEGQNDEVLANVTINNFSSQSLSFISSQGSALTSTPAGNNQYKISVPHDAKCIYAEYNGLKVGKLNIVSLKALTKKLVIVPVNNAAINSSTLESELNTIYKQANITWQISIASNFNNTAWDINKDSKLEITDATLMSKYSAEMRALRDAYKQADSTYDRSSYYLFAVNDLSDPALKGYMVRGRAMGFIKANSDARTIAHELAHGAFGLEHSFPKVPQGQSNNLLDYAIGTQLVKTQWLATQSTTPIINWFDEEEDAALGIDDWLKILLGKECYDKYITHNGIIPPCVWEKEQVYNPNFDLPQMCGTIDAVYITIRDVVSLGQFFSCWNPIAVGVYASPQCITTRDNTFETVVTVKDLIYNPVKQVLFYNAIKNELSNWWDGTSCMTPQCRYSQGKLTFDIISTFVGVEEIKLGLKGGITSAKIVEVFKKVPATIKKLNKSLSTLGCKFKNVSAQYILYITLNTAELEVGKIDNLTGAITPNKWISNPTEVLKTVKDIDYRDAQNVVKRGDVELVKDGNGGVGWREVNVANLLSRFENLTQSELKQLYGNFPKTKIVGTKATVSQGEILAEITASKTLYNPYNFSYRIENILLSEEALFVRVHNISNPNRPWLIAVEDFKQFSSMDDMIKKLALPVLDNTGNVIKPTELSFAKLPVGTTVRKSVVRPQDWPGQGHLPGGAWQYEIRGFAKPEWFKKIGSLNEYLN